MRIIFYLLCLIETSKMYIENSNIEYVQETHGCGIGVGFNGHFIDNRVYKLEYFFFVFGFYCNILCY